MPKDTWLLYHPGLSRLHDSNKNSQILSAQQSFISCLCDLSIVCLLGDSAPCFNQTYNVVYYLWAFLWAVPFTCHSSLPSVSGKLLLVLQVLDQTSNFLENLPWIWLKVVLSLVPTKFSGLTPPDYPAVDGLLDCTQVDFLLLGGRDCALVISVSSVLLMEPDSSKC